MGPMGAPSCGQDHPRAGGEHSHMSAELLKTDGSSPRRRGAHEEVRAGVAEWGIIPAQAGSTLLTPPTVTTVPDHPRAGGEHAGCGVVPVGGGGSSPRRRGAHDHHPLRRRPGRIIPAQAGSTRGGRTAGEQVGDHPRAGGEHRPPRLRVTSDRGSSPRRRGARPNLFPKGVVHGIIPAQAGSTRD